MTVSIDIVGHRIHLSSPYDPQVVRLCKTVAGANWSKTKGVWTYPLTVETCLMLRDRFGTSMKVTPALSAWYREAFAEREHLASLANAPDAELQRLPKVAPDLAAAMERRKYQRSGVRFAADGRAVLIADDPGLGKTLIGMGTVVESGVPGPYLVVCPKTAVESVWSRELRRWLWQMEPEVVTVPDGRAKRDQILNGLQELEGARLLDNTWVVVHPEMLRVKRFWVCKECGSETPITRKPKQLKCLHNPDKSVIRNDATFPQLLSVEWGAVICDESDRAIVMNSGTPTLIRNGMDLVRLKPDGIRLAMSGTPFRSRPHLIWSTLNWLDGKTYSGKWRWVAQFWKLGGYSGYEIGDLISPDSERMLWDSLKGIVLRRTKAEVADDLPPKVHVGTPYDPTDENSPVGVWLPMEGKQAKLYQEMLKTGSVELPGGTLTAIGTLAERTRLTQLATSCGQMVGLDYHPSMPSNKFDWLVQALEEWGFPDDPCTKVIVGSQYVEVLELFQRGLRSLKPSIDSVMLTGKVTGKNRAALIEQFNDPDEAPHILFLQYDTGGVAITIDSADKMVLIDEDVPHVMTQVEDRIHRVSNPRNVEYYYLRSEGTTDVGIALVNAELAQNSRRLLDERRGVEYLRRVLELSRV